MAEQLIMNKEEMEDVIDSLVEQVCNDVEDFSSFGIIGVQTRGVYLADRIQAKIEEKTGVKIDSGILDITFYRDDLTKRDKLPLIKETKIDFDVTDKTLLLVDDVVYTGRTVKAALETLTSFGRPGKIKLLAMVDRGNRELPIGPDYCGITIETTKADMVNVLLAEKDGEDRVDLIKN